MAKNTDTGQEAAVVRTDGDSSATVSPSTTTVAQDGSEYTTRGETKVATRPGREFRGSNKSLPTITPEGVKVTADQADKLIEEANRYHSGLVFKVEDEK